MTSDTILNQTVPGPNQVSPELEKTSRTIPDSTPPPDPNSYKMSFPSPKPTQPSPTLQPLDSTISSGEPLLASEIQEISEEEFLNNVGKIQELAKTCSQLRIPKSIRKDVEGIISRLDTICKGMPALSSKFWFQITEILISDYEENKALPADECLSVKPASQPAITRSSTSATSNRTYKPKKTSQPPVSIKSHISSSSTKSTNDASEDSSASQNQNQISKIIDPANTPDPTDQTQETVPPPEDQSEAPSTASKDPTSRPKRRKHVTLTRPLSKGAKRKTQKRSRSQITSSEDENTSPSHESKKKRPGNPASSEPPTTDKSHSPPPERARSSSLSTITTSSEDTSESEEQEKEPEKTKDPESNEVHHPDEPPPRTPSTPNPGPESPNTSPNIPEIITLENFTLIPGDSLRSELQELAEWFQKGRVSKTKWERGWNSLCPMLKFRLTSPEISKIPTASFVYNNAQFNHESWIKEICESKSEPWYSPDVLDLELLKKQIQSTNPILPLNSKASHPESNIFRALVSLINTPNPRLIREWAKSVALSIQHISDENPQAPRIESKPNSMERHLIVLTWLNTMKNTMPNLPRLTEGDDTDGQSTNQQLTTCAPLSTDDALDDLRKMIIDLMMSYTIIQAHIDEQFNPRKKNKSRKTSSDTTTVQKSDQHSSLSKIENNIL
ncbi:hypothetical protein PGT21_022869 [Puccinia graminis f. sp. tritici]|uniref:Uncharacterized protein n=1 Tax=Puccinia graminis f. sp. tritici TaxID=56615 RepID=A0A5B0QBE9_PUCGR|nr:hypothetical protein PGT21_022869 [Puccinia graminis f. sp. tritici]